MAAPEQHFLRPDRSRGLLAGVGVEGRPAIEFGAGRGTLTRILLDLGVGSIEAWELDPGLGEPFSDPRLHWRAADIRTATHADVADRVVAAFPPYSLLPFLLDLCAGCPDLLLMAPPRMAAECAALGLGVLADLDGDAFDPISGGRHLVLGRGAFKP